MLKFEELEKRPGGRLKRRLIDVMEEDMKIVDVREEDL